MRNSEFETPSSITLCLNFALSGVTVLLSLTVFQQSISDAMPVTSLQIPLLGKCLVTIKQTGSKFFRNGGLNNHLSVLLQIIYVLWQSKFMYIDLNSDTYLRLQTYNLLSEAITVQWLVQFCQIVLLFLNVVTC